MNNRVILTVLYLSLLLSISGCSVEPFQMDRLDSLNTASKNMAIKKVKLGVINSENTRKAYRYITEFKASPAIIASNIDPDAAGLDKAIKEILAAIFGEVVYVNSFEDAHAKHAQLVAIVDLHAIIGGGTGGIHTLDMTVDFRKLNGESIGIASGSSNKVVGYPYFLHFNWQPTAKEALENLTTAMTATLVTPAFVAKVMSTPKTADSTVGLAGLIEGGVTSDIDELPAIKSKSNQNTYAIVIGIENYRQGLPNAKFATHDAQTVTEYLTKVMGYPEENVITLLNDRALKSDLTKYFEKWLSNNVEADSTVFIYYAGHGAPDLKSGSAYLVPYDGDPAFIDQTGYSLSRMYDALGKLPAQKIIVALDSGFSGAGGRSVIAKGARPLVMNLQSIAALPRNLTVLSATSTDQTSSTYDEKGHGLFTYFMLKGIKSEGVTNQNGSLDINDLFNYIKPQVERVARKQFNNEQSPQLIEAKQNQATAPPAHAN